MTQMNWPSWLPLRDDLRSLSPYGAPQLPADAVMNTNAEHEYIREYLGIQVVPDMFFGSNRLYITCVDYNLLLEFSPIDCILCCKFSEQRARLYGEIGEPAPAVKDSSEKMPDKGSCKCFSKLP